MKCTTALIASVLLVVCALLAGCTSPTASEIKPPVTATVTTVPPATVTTETALPVTPDAVETLPSEQFVDLALEKQRPDSSIHLLYNGGKGEIYVQKIFMKVTLSDGTVVEKYMNDGYRQPRRGDELVIEGTRGTDQVQVFVTSAGKTYKVKDEPLVLSYLLQ